MLASDTHQVDSHKVLAEPPSFLVWPMRNLGQLEGQVGALPLHCWQATPRSTSNVTNVAEEVVSIWRSQHSSTHSNWQCQTHM